MAEVINLRLARKARQRSAAQREAETNRALHGETKAQREQRAAEAERTRRTLDGAKREDD